MMRGTAEFSFSYLLILLALASMIYLELRCFPFCLTALFFWNSLIELWTIVDKLSNVNFYSTEQRFGILIFSKLVWLSPWKHHTIDTQFKKKKIPSLCPISLLQTFSYCESKMERTSDHFKRNRANLSDMSPLPPWIGPSCGLRVPPPTIVTFPPPLPQPSLMAQPSSN